MIMEQLPFVWHEFIGEDENDRKVWYNTGNKYWEKQHPTVDGMLGGFGYLSEIDIKSSKKFLLRNMKNVSITGSLPGSYALDCGCGIGRITKHMLGSVFDRVDLVDQSDHLTEKAAKYIGDNASIGSIYTSGLQDFQPQEGMYNCVWIQWVLGYLVDDDFIKFLIRIRKSLVSDGNAMVFVKENITTSDNVLVDEEDYSITRSDEGYRDCFSKAGLLMVDSEEQKDFPPTLFKVMIYALIPDKLPGE